MKNRIHVIITDLYDEQVYEEVMERFNFQAENPLLQALHQDLFHALFQAYPEIAPIEEMARPYKFNHHQLTMLMETEEFKQMKVASTHDEMAAGMTAVVFYSRLKERWENDPELSKILDKAKEIQQWEDMLERMLDEEVVYNELAERTDNEEQRREFKQRADEAQKKASAINEKLAALESELTNMQAAVQSKIRQTYRDVAEEVTEEVVEIQAAVSAWGSGTGGLGEVNPKERIELAKKLQANPRLKTLADMIGRMKNLASAKLEERIKKEPSMLVGVTLGDDLEGVLTEELSLLPGQAKPLFYNKYVEQSLLQYQREGKKKSGRGPIVALLDNSDSMKGTPELMLKAIILGGVLTAAAREKRDVHLVMFSDDVVAEFSFPKDMGDKDRIRTMLEVAEIGPAGGTDYVPPLTRGVEKITKEHQKADILFITDGLCEVPEDFLKWYRHKKEQKGFRTVSVLVGSDEIEALKGFSDKIYAFQSLGDDIAHSILDEII